MVQMHICRSPGQDILVLGSQSRMSMSNCSRTADGNPEGSHKSAGHSCSSGSFPQIKEKLRMLLSAASTKSICRDFSSSRWTGDEGITFHLVSLSFLATGWDQRRGTSKCLKMAPISSGPKIMWSPGKYGSFLPVTALIMELVVTRAIPSLDCVI